MIISLFLLVLSLTFVIVISIIGAGNANLGNKILLWLNYLGFKVLYFFLSPFLKFSRRKDKFYVELIIFSIFNPHIHILTLLFLLRFLLYIFSIIP